MDSPEHHNYGFSPNANRVLNRASDVARDFANDAVEPEAILLAILQLPACNATDTLRRLEINSLELSYKLEALLYERATAKAGQIVFGTRALATLGMAQRAAQQLGDGQITTLHLLLALVQDRTQPLRTLWEDLNLNPQSIVERWDEGIGPDGEETSASDMQDVQVTDEAELASAVSRGKEGSMDSGQLFYNYFSFSAKKAIYRASEICQQFSNQFVEPEHIFFSILQLRSCSAVQVLQRLNVNLPKLTYSLEAALYERAGNFKGNNAFSARALALLDSSFREVKQLNHREIGTVHLLIALASERSPALRELFDEHRLDAKRIRETFLQHLRGYGTQGVQSRSELGWPRSITQTITVGGVPFTPGKTFHHHALQLIAAAAQLAVAYRQPETAPAELLAAMVIGAAGPLREIDVLLKLDAVALQAALAEHWCTHALPVGEQLAEPPTSAALTDLLGRAFARMVQEAGSVGGTHLVLAEHLLLAVLTEPTEPLRGFLGTQQGGDSVFATAMAEWEQQRREATEAVAAEEQQAEEWTTLHRAGSFIIPEMVAEEGSQKPADAATWAEQLGLEYIDLQKATLDPAVAMLIPAETSLRLKALPVRMEGNLVVLAMVDPLDRAAFDEFWRLTDRDVLPQVTSEEDFRWAHAQVFGTG